MAAAPVNTAPVAVPVVTLVQTGAVSLEDCRLGAALPPAPPGGIVLLIQWRCAAPLDLRGRAEHMEHELEAGSR